MHGRKLPQIFLGILSFLLCASLARAAYWKFAVPFGGGSDSAMSVAKSQKYEKIDRHFIELKMALANEAQFRKPASEKINIMKAKLVEFNEIRKSQGYVGVTRELDMDLYTKSINMWVFDPQFSLKKCSLYKHKFLVGFEPQAEDAPVTVPLDQSFQILDKTCQLST